MLKRICLLLCAVCLVLSGISCRAPEMSEIEQRLGELIEASYGVNEILFGEGLPVYERVYEPKASYYKDAEGKGFYYYEIEDSDAGTVLAYRSVTQYGSYTYLQRVSEKRDGEEAVYADPAGQFYLYPIGYEEKKYDFYYSENDPADYDYVRIDAPYTSIEEIKAYAETVYGKEYLESVYEMLFTGAVLDIDVESGQLGARYYLHHDDMGGAHLMKSNKHKALVTEKRIYDLSTAKIVRPSNKKLVNVEIETYLESKPEERLTVRLSMVKQDGEWFLDSGTY